MQKNTYSYTSKIKKQLIILMICNVRKTMQTKNYPTHVLFCLMEYAESTIHSRCRK